MLQIFVIVQKEKERERKMIIKAEEKLSIKVLKAEIDADVKVEVINYPARIFTRETEVVDYWRFVRWALLDFLEPLFQFLRNLNE